MDQSKRKKSRCKKERESLGDRRGSQNKSRRSHNMTVSETSHLQELTRAHYNKKVQVLKKYIDDMDKLSILETSLRGSMRSTPKDGDVSVRKRLAIESENAYFVQKINELQSESNTKNSQIAQLQTQSKRQQAELQTAAHENICLKKMIDLLNRENAVLKKAMNLQPKVDKAPLTTQSTTTNEKQNRPQTNCQCPCRNRKLL